MKIQRIIRAAALSASLAGLAGCTALSSVQSASEPLDTFELSPLPSAVGTRSRGRTQLQVEVPTASGAIATDKIVIKPSPLQVQTLPGVRWVDDATDHFQLLLVRSLANSGRFGLVSGDSAGPSPDYTIVTDLQAFQAELDPDPDPSMTVVIRTTMTLIREEDGRILSTRSSEQKAMAESEMPEAVVAAFQQAMTKQLEATTGWITTTLR